MLNSSGKDMQVSHHAEGWVELTTKSNIESAERVAELLSTLAAQKVSQDDRDEIKIVANELLGNAIEWGNCHDESLAVKVSYALFDGEIVMKVEDEGEGFNPEEVPDPSHNPLEVLNDRTEQGKRMGGFGILMAKKLMDRVVYSARGNAVIISKSLKTDSN